MGVVGADEAAERLNELIVAACSEVVGPELARRVLALPKERVRASPKASAGGADYRCHAPVTVFRKLDAMTRASRDASGADAPEPPASPTEPGTMRASRRPDGAIDVVVVSALGVARHRTYADATQIADAMIEAMDPRALSELVADVRVELAPPDAPRGGVGTIALLTKRRLLENGANGALLCRRCGRMFAGDKGLATHQQVKHGRSYESAKAAVAESRVALVATTQSAPHQTFSPDPSRANPSTSANFQRRRRAGEEKGSPLPRASPRRGTATWTPFASCRRVASSTRRGASIDTAATRCTGPPVPATSACANTWSTRAAWTRGRRRLRTAVTPCTGRRVTEKRTCASGCGARKG